MWVYIYLFLCDLQSKSGPFSHSFVDLFNLQAYQNKMPEKLFIPTQH